MTNENRRSDTAARQRRALPTILAIAIGMTLGPLAAGAGAATPSVSVVSQSTAMTATTNFTAASATATCPGGSTLVSGGDELTRAGSPVSNDGAVTLGVYPSDASGTQSAASTTTPMSWTATGGYSGQAPGLDTVTSYAVCATGVTGATTVAVAKTATGTLGPVTAPCPTGTSLVGGGGGYTAFISGTNTKIYDSFPSDAAGHLPAAGATNSTAWTVQGNSNSATGPVTTAIALCATDVTVQTQVATASNSIASPPGGAAVAATASCPANTTLLAGGSNITANPSGPGTGGQGVHVIGDFPSDSAANPVASGPAAAWTVIAQNGGQGLTSLASESLALCMTPPPATPGQISGTVTDSANNGIPNICVYPFDAATGNRTADAAACTDSQGRYTLTVAAAGSYDLVFYDATGSFTTQWYNGVPFEGQATPVTVNNAPVTGINAKLQSAGTGTQITGTVKDAGGNGIANVCVYPFDATTGNRTADPAACTSPTGAYDLSLAAPGSYNVVFYDATGTYPTQWYSGAAFEGQATPVTVTAGATASGINAVLGSSSEITGTVKNAAGVGIPNICVYPFDAATGNRTADPAACTSATGTYTLNLGAAGSYNVVFYDATGTYQTQWYSGAQFEGQATPVAVTAGAATAGIDATLTS